MMTPTDAPEDPRRSSEPASPTEGSPLPEPPSTSMPPEGAVPATAEAPLAELAPAADPVDAPAGTADAPAATLPAGNQAGVASTETPAPVRRAAHRPDPDFGATLWLALWSATLALGVATGSSVWERIEARAAERAVLLLPMSETSEADRQQWLASLLERKAIASGEWLSPTSLVQRVSASVPPELWAELFSEDDAWLPWLLQLRPAAPLENQDGLGATLEAFRADPRFRLVLFDEAALERDARIWRHVRTGTFLFAGLFMTFGTLALLLSPGLTRYPIDAPIAGLLAVALAAASGYALQRFGAPLDRNQYLRSLATAFGLAALLGPMLKGRLTQVIRRRGA